MTAPFLKAAFSVMTVHAVVGFVAASPAAAGQLHCRAVIKSWNEIMPSAAPSGYRRLNVGPPNHQPPASYSGCKITDSYSKPGSNTAYITLSAGDRKKPQYAQGHFAQGYKTLIADQRKPNAIPVQVNVVPSLGDIGGYTTTWSYRRERTTAVSMTKGEVIVTAYVKAPTSMPTATAMRISQQLAQALYQNLDVSRSQVLVPFPPRGTNRATSPPCPSGARSSTDLFGTGSSRPCGPSSQSSDGASRVQPPRPDTTNQRTDTTTQPNKPNDAGNPEPKPKAPTIANPDDGKLGKRRFYISIRADKLAVRYAAPSTHSDRIDTLKNGTRGLKRKRTTRTRRHHWSKVCGSGPCGWVLSKYVKRETGPSNSGDPVQPVFRSLQGVIGIVMDDGTNAQLCRRNGKCLPAGGTEIETGDALKSSKRTTFFIEGVKEPKAMHALTGRISRFTLKKNNRGKLKITLRLASGELDGDISNGVKHVISIRGGHCSLRRGIYRASALSSGATFTIVNGVADCYNGSRLIRVDQDNPIVRW